MDLIIPREVNVEETIPGRSAKIVFEPLERGYGATLGNGLRRMLLSSLSGAAITSVRIETVKHEFDALKGVREDVLNILLTLKGVELLLEGSDVATLTLDVKGPAVVTAADLQAPAGLSVLNPELEIAHLNEDAHLRFEARVEKGYGYVPATEREASDDSFGSLLLDASFSPIKKVAVRVENARVSQKTNYDKLIMEVETNGSIAPEDAIVKAATIMQAQLDVFVDFSLAGSCEEQTDQPGLTDLLNQPIDHLDLSVRSLNCLKSDNVFYVGDLVLRTEQEMLRTPNFGRKSLTEIKDALVSMGLSLGMEIDDWSPEAIGEEVSE